MRNAYTRLQIHVPRYIIINITNFDFYGYSAYYRARPRKAKLTSEHIINNVVLVIRSNKSREIQFVGPVKIFVNDWNRCFVVHRG